MKILSIAAALSLVIINAHATPKMPHSHHAVHHGKVMMFGDDHLELVGDSDTHTITIYVTDKMRDPLAIKDVTLSVLLQSNGKTQPLELKQMPQANEATVNVTSEQVFGGILKIRLLRKSPPKGHIAGNLELPVPLSHLFNK